MSPIDRSIRLDVSVPDFGSQLNTQDGQDGPGNNNNSLLKKAVDSQVQQRFDTAMATQSALPIASSASAALLSPLTTPLSLFGAWSAAVSAASSPPSAASPFDAEISEALLERLMVSDGSGNNGGKQVRMELKSDVLPGVTIAIEEAEGRFQVNFICSVESSRMRLNASAPVHAQTLAERLQRLVLLRVQTNDVDDLCLFEVAAGPA